MNPFTWLIGAGFWTVYMGIGVVICAYFITLAMPNYYKIMKGEIEPDSDGDWNVGGTYIFKKCFKVTIVSTVFAVLFFWPVVVILFTLKWAVLFFLKASYSFIITTIKTTAEKLPEIKITTRKEKEKSTEL